MNHPIFIISSIITIFSIGFLYPMDKMAISIKTGKINTIERLLQLGFNPNTKISDRTKQTPLIFTVLHYNVINLINNNPMFMKVQKKSVKKETFYAISECLMKNGGDIHACDINNVSALNYIASLCDLNWLKFLIKKGIPDINFYDCTNSKSLLKKAQQSQYHENYEEFMNFLQSIKKTVQLSTDDFKKIYKKKESDSLSFYAGQIKIMNSVAKKDLKTFKEMYALTQQFPPMIMQNSAPEFIDHIIQSNKKNTETTEQFFYQACNYCAQDLYNVKKLHKNLCSATEKASSLQNNLKRAYTKSSNPKVRNWLKKLNTHQLLKISKSFYTGNEVICNIYDTSTQKNRSLIIPHEIWMHIITLTESKD